MSFPVDTQDRRVDPIRRLICGILLVVLCLVLGMLLWRFADCSATLLAYPYEWDEGEGIAIYHAMRLAEGHGIYGDMNKLPMLSAGYPPVYHAVVSLFVPYLGATLFAGRIVSLAALAGLCVLIVVAVRQETKRWGLGLLAAALFIASPYVTIWGPLARVDTLATFLIIGGLLLVRQYPRSRAALPVGLLVVLAACYAKYQVSFLSFAGFGYLWRYGKRVTGVAFVSFTVAGLGVLAWLMYRSHGQFWRSTVTAHESLYYFSTLVSYTKGFLWVHAVIVAATVWWVSRGMWRRCLDIWGFAALASIPIVLTTGSMGASINYYLPIIAVAVICTARTIECLDLKLTSARSFITTCSVLLVLAAEGVLFAGYEVRKPTETDRQSAGRILDLVRQADGDVLTERRVMFSLLAGRQPQLDACMLFYAYYAGRGSGAGADSAAGRGLPPQRGKTGCWDPRELIEALDQRRFPLLIVEVRHLPPEVMRAIARNYEPLLDERIAVGNWHGVNRYFVMSPIEGVSDGGRTVPQGR